MSSVSHWFSNYLELPRRLKVINEHSYLYNFFFKQTHDVFRQIARVVNLGRENVCVEWIRVYEYKEKLTDKPNVNEGWRIRVDHPDHINKDGHQLKAHKVLEVSSWVWYVVSTPWIPGSIHWNILSYWVPQYPFLISYNDKW